MTEYCQSVYLEKQEDKLFKVYVTDALKIFGQLNMRYYDVISSKVEKPTESREEIINRLSKKLDEIGES